jgi:hypothetical protein
MITSITLNTGAPRWMAERWHKDWGAVTLDANTVIKPAP